jgi:hypothetical protein
MFVTDESDLSSTESQPPSHRWTVALQGYFNDITEEVSASA